MICRCRCIHTPSTNALYRKAAQAIEIPPSFRKFSLYNSVLFLIACSPSVRRILKEGADVGMPFVALLFITMPFQHSEHLPDHKLLEAKMLERREAKDASPEMKEFIDKIIVIESDHTAVIEKFGRYPHRNKRLGRESTKEEQEWLACPDLPRWAKNA